MLSDLWEGTAGWPELAGRVAYPTRAHALELALQLSRGVPGHVVELGVFQGQSARILRDELWRIRRWDRRSRHTRIYACDAFRGLPEAYQDLPAGAFQTAVPRLTGIHVVEGWFDQTLTPELAAEVGRVRLAHLDADLESSTDTALTWLTPLLGPGSLLLFDELLGDDPAEARSLQRWLDASGVRVELLALLGREPSGDLAAARRPDRRALLQVVGQVPRRAPRPLLPTRLRRRLAARL